jgi:poly(3-hydroxyalkanoate) synthetase
MKKFIWKIRYFFVKVLMGNEALIMNCEFWRENSTVHPKKCLHLCHNTFNSDKGNGEFCLTINK